MHYRYNNTMNYELAVSGQCLLQASITDDHLPIQQQ
jgi:hypothetical protein